MALKDLIRKLSPLRLAPNSAGADEGVRLLQAELPFLVHEFVGGLEHNGWVVPMKWEVERATIHNPNGSLVYDGLWHPLAVIGYSQAFQGRVRGDELKRHLFFPSAFDDALVYHCDLFYKPFRKEWGFSVTKRFYDAIGDERFYDVDLKTTFEPGTMKVCEYVLPGASPDSIVLNAHNCHAFCCNDDLAGVSVGVEVMRRLERWSNRRFTYRLVIAPEHFGSIFYLTKLPPGLTLRYGLFLEMLGTTGGLALQRSFLGDTMVDRALLLALKHSGKPFRTDRFRKIVGNDETCWEAVGFEVPFPSLSRSIGVGHFPEYHTSRDNIDLIDENMLVEAADIVTEALYALDNDAVMTRHFRGLVALSHPRYDLYKPFYDPSEPDRKTISDQARNWNYLMDCLPRYFDGDTRLIEIAEKFDLPFQAVHDYVRQFEAKGLVAMHPPKLDRPPRELAPR